MVFGKMGVSATRNPGSRRTPSTGESKLYGEFLINAQGEDVVAGIRTPQDITEEARQEIPAPTSRRWKARCRRRSRTDAALLDRRPQDDRDMQDIEFTVEQGKLWMLQTRRRQAHGESRAADRSRTRQ